MLSKIRNFYNRTPAPQVVPLTDTSGDLVAATDFITKERDWCLLASVLLDVLHEKKGATYLAATLIIPFNGKHLLLNLTNAPREKGKEMEKQNPFFVEAILCQIYAKYKKPSHVYYEYAKAISDEQEEILAHHAMTGE